jgi:hypothetical protein
MQDIPASLRAGDTWAWRDSYPDYKANEGWALSYVLVNVATKIDLPSGGISADGADFAITVAAATTNGYAPGIYSLVARVTRSGEVHTVRSSTLQVTPNLTAATDTRSHARKVLEAIEAVLERRATLDQENYTIGTRSLARTPIPELILLRDKYRREAYAEKAAEALAQGLTPSGRIQVRF